MPSYINHFRDREGMFIVSGAKTMSLAYNLEFGTSILGSLWSLGTGTKGLVRYSIVIRIEKGSQFKHPLTIGARPGLGPNLIMRLPVTFGLN